MNHQRITTLLLWKDIIRLGCGLLGIKLLWLLLSLAETWATR